MEIGDEYDWSGRWGRTVMSWRILEENGLPLMTKSDENRVRGGEPATDDL